MRVYTFVLFIVLLLMFYALTQHSQMLAKPLAGRSRRMSCVFAALALMTFFLPVVKFEQATFGRTQWSAYDMLMGQLSGTFHPLGFAVEEIVIGACYAALVSALVVAGFFPSRRLLIHLAFIASWLALQAYGWGHIDLARMFIPYGTRNVQIHYASGAYLLPILAAVLLLISASGEAHREERVQRD